MAGMTGIEVDEKVGREFEAMKCGAKKDSYAYMQMVISDDGKKVVIEKYGEKPGENFESFVAQLPPEECRYAVVDYSAKGADTARNVLVFIAWSPDAAKVKNKMMYAGTKEAVKKICSCNAVIQASDLSDLDADSINEKCNLK